MPGVPVVSAASALLNPWDDLNLDAVIKGVSSNGSLGHDFWLRFVTKMLLVGWRVHRCFGGLLVIDDQWRPQNKIPPSNEKYHHLNNLPFISSWNKGYVKYNQGWMVSRPWLMRVSAHKALAFHGTAHHAWGDVDCLWNYRKVGGQRCGIDVELK